MEKRERESGEEGIGGKREREGKLRRHRRRHHNRGGDKCVVGTLGNTLVRGETNQDFNSQVIHQPEILFPLPSELQFHSY